MKRAFLLTALFAVLGFCRAFAQAETDVSSMSNVVYLEKTNVKKGGTATLSFNLKNAVEVQTIGLEVYLPEGISVANNSKGKPDVTLSLERTDYSCHSLTSSLHEGYCKVSLLGIDSDSPFNEGDGEIFTMNVSVSDDIAAGEYLVALKEVELSNSDNTYNIEDTYFTLKVYDTYTRTVTPGNFGTICLPWDVELSEVEGAEFYSLAGKVMSGGKASSIVAEKVEEKLVAGTPYIFKATAGTITADYSSSAASAAGSVNGLTGTFADNSSIAGMYMIANNSVRKCAAGSTCKANRAYIDMANVPVYTAPSGYAKRKVSIGMDDGEMTGIDDVEACSEDTEVYSVAGIRKSSVSNGINIVKNKSGIKKILK